MTIDELINEVQVFLQDHPRLNVLIRTRQFTPTLVRIAAKMMLAAFNKLNWVSRYKLEELPEEELFDSIIYGTLYHLMNAEAALQVRNHLPYNDAGLSVAEFAKSGEYQTLMGSYQTLFREGALSWKYQKNIEQGFGGVSSEYANYGGIAIYTDN